jgi:hypothetical protein
LQPAADVRLHLASLLLLPALASAPASAEEPPLMSLELQVSGGVAMNASSRASWHQAPVSVAVGAEYAVIAQPWTSFYGMAFIEGVDAIDAGLKGGVRFRPSAAGARVSAGGVMVLAPDVKVGASAALGGCFLPGRGEIRFCTDLEGLAFVSPDDGSVSTQLKLALELGFDVL